MVSILNQTSGTFDPLGRVNTDVQTTVKLIHIKIIFMKTSSKKLLAHFNELFFNLFGSFV